MGTKPYHPPKVTELVPNEGVRGSGRWKAREEFGEWELIAEDKSNGDYRTAVLGDPLAQGQRIRVIETECAAQYRDAALRHHRERDEARARTAVAEARLERVREAVRAWESGEWDVILMDVQMPVMDGPNACALIRGREALEGRARTPIIALTANAMAHQVAEYMAAGMDGFVPKPIEVGRLFEALQQVLEAAGEAEAA